MEFYANLHTHSTHSVGQFSPSELARVAKEEGYRALSLTDHDTATGFGELKAECDKIGLECIFGTEFTGPSHLLPRPGKPDGQFHITAYHYDPEYPAMKEYLRGMSLRETDQTRILFERGVALGKLKGITWDEVLEFNEGITWLCNEHLFRALLAKDLIRNEDYTQYFDELFGVHRGEVPPCYPFLPAQDLIKLIHDAGGIALVAHPNRQLHLIDDLIAMGIAGMEVWHPDLPQSEREKAYQIALEKNLYISGGTDHSGLCDNAYERYAGEENNPHFIPRMSAGTTYDYFVEIRDRKISR